MSIYDTLNKEQKDACFHTEGPVLILAGAGSGKTRVITHRIAYLMEECAVNPWNILAITFTNKAAGEMRERVDRLIGFGSEGVWISTFHSMCVRILRRHIDRIGFDQRFTIYDADDQKSLIKKIIKRRNIDSEMYTERSVQSAISSAKNNLQTPGQYRETHTIDPFGQIVADIYEEYEKELRANNALDFDDLLTRTVELFRADREVLRGYQERFRYIMVDEYQDTNHVQFEIVRMLAGGYRNLCVVGDDDQSIYKFRGADIRNILDFEKIYRDAYVVRLEQNYRSTQNVLDAANAVIAHNSSRKAKRLWTDQGAGKPIHYHEFNSAPEEASFVAQDIQKRMRDNHRLSYKDFAVLYRTNAQSRLIEDKMVLCSIPYSIVGGHNFYDRKEIRDILGYLRTINNGSDDISCERILNIPKRGIGSATIAKIEQIAQESEVGFFEVLEHAGAYPVLGRSARRLREFADLILDLREYSEEHSVSDLLRKIVDLIGYEQYLEDYDADTRSDRMENVQEFYNKAVAWEEEVLGSEEADSTLAGFLEEVSLVADIDQVGENDNRVLLMTMHSAKGLEFPQVYLVGMEDGLFPSSASIGAENGDALEEERRLAYVGITRAKEELTLTMAHSRMVYGNVANNSVSRFVWEIPPELLDGVPSGGFGTWWKKGSLREDHLWGEDRDSVWDSPDSNTGDGGSDNTLLHRKGPEGRDIGKSAAGGTGTAAMRGGNVAVGRGSYAAGAEGSMRQQADVRPKAARGKAHTKSSAKPYLSGRSGLDTLQKGAPAGAKPDYGPGDRVRHVKFGDGTVENVEAAPKDYKVRVLFDEAGEKVMYAAFAKLVKI